MNNASAGDLLFHFKGDTKDLDKKTKDAEKNLKDTLNSIGNAMTVGATIPLTAIATAGVKYNAELESYTANLTTLLNGNKKQAEELLNTLKETAKTTPYETSHLVKATQTMMSFGISAKDSQKYLSQIGDISMGNAEKLSGLTLAFSQVQSAGKLTGQDLLQMINQGFNPLNIISKETGESMASLKERMSEGGVSAQEVAHAFEIATSKGGLFYKGMEKGAQTTEGKISTLKDSFKEATGSLTESLLPALTSIVQALTKVADWFANLSENGKTVVLIIGGIVASIGPLIKIGMGIHKLYTGFKLFTSAMKTLQIATKLMSVAQAGLNLVMSMNPITLIIIAIVALIAILVLLYNKCEWFRNLVNAIFTYVINGVKQIWSAIQPFVNFVISVVKQIIVALQPVIEWIVNFVKQYIQIYIAMIIAYINLVVAVIKGIVNIVITVVKGIINAVKSVINFAKSIPSKVQNLVNRIVGFFQALPGRMLNIGLDIVRGIGNGITNGIGWIKNRIKSFVGNVTSFIKKMFKIGSPSKLMSLEVGQWIPKGVAVGIEANTDSVYDAMKTMQTDMMSAIGLDSGFVAQSGLHYSPNIIVNNDINMRTDPLGQVVGNIKTFSGGAKNDYNYGMGV